MDVFQFLQMHSCDLHVTPFAVRYMISKLEKTMLLPPIKVSDITFQTYLYHLMCAFHNQMVQCIVAVGRECENLL
jgi:hypothetical protein